MFLFRADLLQSVEYILEKSMIFSIGGADTAHECDYIGGEGGVVKYPKWKLASLKDHQAH